MTDDVFARIRCAAAEVADEARFVRLDESRLAPYAASLVATGLPPLEYDAVHHYRGAPADMAAFWLTLDAVNFGSGYFPHLRKRPGMSGYFTVASSLKDRWEQEGALSGAALRTLTPEDCAVLFGQEGNIGPAQELITHFARALNDLGAWLLPCGDDPLAAIAAANHSAGRLIEMLATMPLFRDVASYRGREIPIYKRAQILVTDLALAFDEQGLGAFDDLDCLTIFADNLVPHVLRVDGLLTYDADLLARLEQGELIPAGSPEEVELRAVAIHAVERLVAELRRLGHATTARELDYLLWNRGLAEQYKALPRHRTRTVFY